MEWGFQWQGEDHVDGVSSTGHDGARDWPVIVWLGNASCQSLLEVVKGLASWADQQTV